MRRLFAALFLCLSASSCALAPAAAHGPAQWIEQGKYKNGAGELCCGEVDCGEKIAGTIEARADGYHVNATFRITPRGGEPIIEHVREIVPHHQVQPSPDGVYWRCRWGGERKCFFAPPPGS